MSARVPSPEQVLRGIFWKLLFRGRTAMRMSSFKVRKQVSLGLTIFFYAVFGIFPAFAALAMDALTYASLLHAMTLMFASLTLASSAGTMLFVKEEAEILLHRPVTPKELLRAKAFVLVAFALLLAFALNLAGTIAGVHSRGATWFFIPAHMVTTVLLMVFSAASIVLVYNASLKWMGRERMYNLLTTLQTLLMVLMMVSGQILPRVIRMDALQHFDPMQGWALALPPVWFGALDALLCGAAAPGAVWFPAMIAPVATAGIAWLAFGKLGAAYGKGLMALNESEGISKSGKARRRLLPALVRRAPLRWWLRDPVERQAFLLVSAYMVRDREIKLKLYPGIAPMLFMPLAMMFSMSGVKNSEVQTWTQTFVACYLAIIPLQAMLLLNRSEHWRAAEFFHLAPLPHWAPLFHGARKAVLGWLTYPVLLLQAAGLALLQRSYLPFVMTLPALLFLPAFSLVPGLVKSWVPFSLPAEEQRDSALGCLLMMIVMVISSIIGGLAMGAWKLGPVWFWSFLAFEAVAMFSIRAAMLFSLRAKPWPTEEE